MKGNETWGCLWSMVGVSQKKETHPHISPLDLLPARVAQVLAWLHSSSLRHFLGLSHYPQMWYPGVVHFGLHVMRAEFEASQG